MGTHPIFESDFDCLTEWVKNKRPRTNSKSTKKEKNPKKIVKKRKNKDKDSADAFRRSLNDAMDKLVEKTDGFKPVRKDFEKVGIPEKVNTDEVEGLIQNL